MREALLALALFAVATPAAATNANALLPADNAADSGDAGAVLTDRPDVDLSDAETSRLSTELDRAELRALIGRTQLAEAMDGYQATMYRHHQFWTDVAAVAVYAITFFGLVCAAAQFRLVARLRGMAVHEEEAASAGAVELPGGAKINSPFLGVIILFLSLGFFYLYLTNVYPILSVAELEAKRAVAGAKPAPK